MGNCIIFAGRETNVTAVGLCVGGRTDISLLVVTLVLLSICLNGKVEMPFYTIWMPP